MPAMTAEPILVTGGAGYIGAHTAKALAACGYLPIVYDDLSLGWADFVRWGPLEIGDVADTPRLISVLRQYAPKAVVHFAALSEVGQSVSRPDRFYANNVAGTLGLLNAMHAAGVAELVFSSSCAVYGAPARTPIAEDEPLKPLNPYGATKAAIERMLADFNAAFGSRSVALRYFNAAGADPASAIGEKHRCESHLIPRAILSALGRIADFAVLGADYDTPDGTAIRDYVHVEDLAAAHVAALRWLRAGGPGETFNLGAGRGHSVREVLSAIAAQLGREVPHRAAARRAGDAPVLIADPAKARRLLDFAPLHSSLDEIIATALRWHALPNSHIEPAPVARVPGTPRRARRTAPTRSGDVFARH